MLPALAAWCPSMPRWPRCYMHRVWQSCFGTMHLHSVASRLMLQLCNAVVVVCGVAWFVASELLLDCTSVHGVMRSKNNLVGDRTTIVKDSLCHVMSVSYTHLTLPTKLEV